jgi:uncharacterized protein (TIGR02466 family)
MIETPLFHISLLSEEEADHTTLNPKVAEEVLRRHNNEPSSAPSLSGEWRSQKDFFQSQTPACMLLRDKIVETSTAAIRELAPPGETRGQRVNFEGWINVNPPGSFNAPHNHYSDSISKLSGIYYVAAPENCGALELLAPQSYWPRNPGGRYTLEPKAGKYIIFPSYIYHWVQPNASAEMRISVAWNMRF